MNITRPRSIATCAAVIGTLAVSAVALVPGVAAAGDRFGCAGKVVHATQHSQTLQGTACSDTFHIGPFSNVTVQAGDGNDTVRAGFGGGMAYLYLGNGNDRVVNPNDRSVWVHAGAGDDVLEGSSGYDAFYGGSGTDSATVTVGDFYDGIEIYL